MPWLRWRKRADGQLWAQLERKIPVPTTERKCGYRIEVEALGTTDARIAAHYLAEARAKEGKAAATKTVDQPQDALKSFLRSKADAGARLGYVEHLGAKLGAIVKHMGDTPMRSWSPSDLEAFLASGSKGPRTRQMYVRAAQQWVKWAKARGDVLLPDFVGHVRAPRLRAKESPSWTQAQVRLLLEAARGTDMEVPIALAAFTALSLGDLRVIEWPQVDLAGGMIRRPREKTGVRLFIPIVPPLHAILKAHVKTVGLVCTDMPESKRGAYDALYRLCDAAGVPRGGFHRFRHSLGSMLDAAGASVPTIGAILGHRPGSAVTLKYTKSDVERMRRGLEAVAATLTEPAAGELADTPPTRSPEGDGG